MDELLKKLGECDAKIDALLAHDELTDEQRAEHEKLSAERAKLVKQIAAEEDREKRAAERAELEAKQKAKASLDAERAKRQAEVGVGRLTTADKPAVPGVHTETEQRKSTLPANLRRAGSLKMFRKERNGMSAEERAYRFGMYGMAMLSISIPGRFRNKDAEEFFEKQWASATSSKDASGAQYLIPEEFSSDIIDLREQYGVARQLLRIETMASDTKTVPRRQGGLTAYFVGESGAGTESSKVWDRVRLTAKDLMVLSRYTAQVDMDAVINFGDDLAGEISYAFANKEDDCAFNGDGTESSYGGITGIRTKLQDVDGAGTDSAGLVTGAGNAYSELVLADFHNVVGKLPQYADTEMAAWVVHRTFYFTVMQKLELAAGGVTSQEIREGRRGRYLFLGYPVNFSQIMPSAEANSQVCALLGDYTKGAAFGDRQQESIAFSQEASINGESLFERNEIGIRGTERFDIVVHDVGSSSASGPIVGLQTAGS